MESVKQFRFGPEVTEFPSLAIPRSRFFECEEVSVASPAKNNVLSTGGASEARDSCTDDDYGFVLCHGDREDRLCFQTPGPKAEAIEVRTMRRSLSSGEFFRRP